MPGLETPTKLNVSQGVRLYTRLFLGLCLFIGGSSIALAILFTTVLQDTETEQLAGDCQETISSLPFTANQAGRIYCFAAALTGSGAVTVAADNITIDGLALRGARNITEYAAWRDAMAVTGISIQGRANTTIKNTDVNGIISIGAVNNAAAASPGTIVRNSTMKSFLISGQGPVWILDNIVHAINGTGRTKIIAGVDKPAPGTVAQSDYVISGNAILSDDTLQNDEPSFGWLYRSPQMIISNNYFYATEASSGLLKDFMRVRDDSSFGYIENNMWGYRPGWYTGDSGNGSTNGEASPLHIAASADGPLYPRNNVFRNNMFRNYSGQAFMTQGWGRGNSFTNNVFVGNSRGLSTYPGQAGLPNNAFIHNTFVNFSTTSGAVLIDTKTELQGQNASTITFNNNLVVNTVGQRLMQCDHEGNVALTGAKNMYYGVGTFLSCFEGSSAVKNQNPGFINATRDEGGDFHVAYCSDPDDYRGAYPCNLPGQSVPAVPQNLVGAVLPDDRPDGIDLTWAPARDDQGVAKYLVERAVDGGSMQAVTTGLGPGILGPGMVDFNIQRGHTYTYRVRSVDGQGNASEWSLPTAVTYPLAPSSPDPTRSVIGSQISAVTAPVILGNTSYQDATDPSLWPKFTVEVKDAAGTPLPQAAVTIDFSQAAVRLWNYQRPGVTLNCSAKTLTVQTDDSGRATFLPQFGGYHLASSAVRVLVDGVTLGTVAAVSSDITGESGTNPLDLSRVLSVRYGSCAEASTCTNFDTVSSFADFNRDRVVNAVDMGMFNSARFVSGTKASYCP